MTVLKWEKWKEDVLAIRYSLVVVSCSLLTYCVFHRVMKSTMFDFSNSVQEPINLNEVEIINVV